MKTLTDVKLSRISYVILYVRDTEKALPFYRDVLGMKLRSTPEPGWVELDAGDLTLALHSREDLPAERGAGVPEVVFNVEDIHQAVEILKSRGVTFSGDPQQVCGDDTHVGLCAGFRDPEGNVLSLFSYIPRKKT